LYLQHGRHPAPIFAIKPLPVAASRDTVGALQHPARHDVAPAPATARTGAVEVPRPRPTSAPAHKDPIADLLATRGVPAQPHVQPPARQPASPATPPAASAPVPPP